MRHAPHARLALLSVLLALASLVSCTQAKPTHPGTKPGTSTAIKPLPGHPVKVACVGDSITAGVGAKGPNSYPAQLQRMLGPGYDVKNFGWSGATLLNAGDKPYQKGKHFENAKAFQPTVVVIMLGANDSKPHNWKHKDEFVADYTTMVKSFQSLESKPKIYVMKPCWVPGKGNFGINEPAVQEELPLVEQVAKDTGAGLIDEHAATVDHPEYFPDRVHPNNQGATVLAATVYRALIGKTYTGPDPIVAPATTTAPTTRATATAPKP